MDIILQIKVDYIWVYIVFISNTIPIFIGLRQRFAEAKKLSTLPLGLPKPVQLLAIVNNSKVVVLKNSRRFYGTDSLWRLQWAWVV